MIVLLKRFLKKSTYVHNISKFLYNKIYNTILLLTSISADISLKKNPKEEEKIKFFNKDFYYPKYSSSYKKAFRNTERMIQIYSNNYNLLNKDFFKKKIDYYLDIGANIGYLASFYKNYMGDDTAKINHCSRNDNAYVFTDDYMIYQLIAIKDIFQNDEITVNYNSTHEDYPFIGSAKDEYNLC